MGRTAREKQLGHFKLILFLAMGSWCLASVVYGQQPQAPAPVAQQPPQTQQLPAQMPPQAQQPAAQQPPQQNPQQALPPAVQPGADGQQPQAQAAPPVAPVTIPEYHEKPARTDAEQEARYARIYERFNQTETSDDEWAKIVGDKVSESYGLQAGDNLWNLSATLFGNPYYWPKVWQLNDEITNPHDVKVGNSLRFTSGNANAAPEVTVAAGEGEPEVDQLATADAGTGQATTKQVVIPPGNKQRPVLLTIPPSFPDWKAPSGGYDKDGFSTEGMGRHTGRTSGHIANIISDKPWASAGEVVEMEGNTTVASTYQVVILKIPGGANVGDAFTVYRNGDEVANPYGGYDDGVEIQLKAHIDIKEKMEGEDSLYRALIVRTAMPVNIGDSIRPGQLITFTEMEEGGSESSVGAHIINGEYNKRKVFGLHNIVYLDRGEQDGLKVGDQLRVLKNFKTRNQDSLLDMDTKSIGMVKVVNTGVRVATAVVVKELEAIMPGDITGTVAGASEKSHSSAPKADGPTAEKPSETPPAPETPTDETLQ